MKKILFFFIKKLAKHNYNNHGFTMIELLVVMLFIGLLSALSLPNFLNQVGKARETEAKNNLGTIARSQQAYHFEKSIFADSLNKLNLNNNLTTRYYNSPAPDIANSVLVKHRSVAINPVKDYVKNYAVGVYYNSGAYELYLCQSYAVNQPVDVPNNISNDCTNNGIKIK